jgi:hypothetical protein
MQERHAMARLRLITLAAAAVCAAGGLATGTLCLMAGAVDQAVAFTWPGIAGAVAFALFAPGDASG